MALNEKLSDALNAQVTVELTAAHEYLAMAMYFDEQNLPGCCNWAFMQADEERMHALKMVNYLHDRGVRVMLQEVPAPPSDFGSPRGAFAKALELEESNTKNINGIYSLALEVADYATQSYMAWFVDEQVEEEKSIGDVLAQMDMIGDSMPGLIMLDRELGQRKSAPSV